MSTRPFYRYCLQDGNPGGDPPSPKYKMLYPPATAAAGPQRRERRTHTRKKSLRQSHVSRYTQHRAVRSHQKVFDALKKKGEEVAFTSVQQSKARSQREQHIPEGGNFPPSQQTSESIFIRTVH